MKVFLTGASSGLGEALARHYAAHGATLGLVRAPRSRVGDGLQQRWRRATVATYRRRRAATPAALAGAARRFHGAVLVLPDVVIAQRGRFARHADGRSAKTCRRFAPVFDTNVLGIVAHVFSSFMVGAAEAHAAARWSGSPASRAFAACRAPGAYSASKAAAITYLESLRVELVGSGVAVVTICPGFIATPLTAGNPLHDAVPARTGRGRAAHGARHCRTPRASTCCRGRWRWLGRDLLLRAAAALRSRGRRPQAQAAAFRLRAI